MPSAAATAAACGPCARVSDNAAWECPARMADGRLFTDYRPRCDIGLQFKAPMSGSYAYRQYLIQNGQNIMSSQRATAFGAARCGPCMSPYEVGTMAPETDRVVCDKVSCARVPVRAPPGTQLPSIGTGREYGQTPEAARASAAFLASRRADQAALARPADGSANCCACPAPMATALPGATATSPAPVRWAVPGGGLPAPAGDPGNLSGVACRGTR